MDSFLVKSESLLRHVAIKCMDWLSFYILDQYVNTLFSIQTVLVFTHWYCSAICESGDIFFNNGPHLSAVAIKKLFSTIKFVMRTSAMEISKVQWSFCGTKSMLLSQWRSVVFLVCVLVNICRFTSAEHFRPLFVGLSALSAVEGSLYSTCFFDTLIYA
jgi:hypothetical protein